MTLFRAWLFGIFLAVAAMTGTTAAWAQAEAQPQASDAAPVAGEAVAIQALIRALEDPEFRARLAEILRAEVEKPAGEPAEPLPAPGNGVPGAYGPGLPGMPGMPSEVPGEPAASPTQPAVADSMIARFVTSLRSMFSGLLQFAANAVDIGRLWGWVKIQAGSAETRAFWVDFLSAMALATIASSGGYWLVRLGLAAPHHRLRRRTEAASSRHRYRSGALLTAAEFAPIATFWALGLGLVSILYFPLRTELVAASIITTAGEALVFAGLARILLRPHTPKLRPLPLDDDVALHLYRSLRRLILWTLLGYALFSNIGALRVPPGVFEGLERIWGLMILGMVLVLAFRYRSDIGEAIRGDGGRLSLLRRFLAQIWLPVIVLYAISAYLIWALEVYQGAELLVRGGVLSVIILLAIQPVDMMLRRWLRSMEAAELSGATAILQSRLLRYAAVLRVLLSALVYAAAVVAIGNAWGLDPIGWLEYHLSGRLNAVIADIAFIGLICWGLWEAFDLWFSLYLGSTDETGARVERSARSRTLLPLLRTTVVVTLVIAFLVASLTSLGLDVAPLLATAGVVGIAVGFGAQKLVQDVITGLFMLFQNTISVGDVVSLAGFTGAVERITVRTLELRDLEGSLHTIPFSAVTTVTNMTRDFAHAMMDIGVAYKENTDTVIEVLKQVGAEFELDPVHGPDLLSSLEVMGLQMLGDSSVSIRCRFKVHSLKQWGVRRAFLARVKHRFDELGIEIPFPQRTLHWGDGPPRGAEPPTDGTAMPEASG